MKAARLYNLLDRALRPTQDDVALPLTPDDIAAAVSTALLAYSRYRPALRRMGTGVLLDSAKAGDTTLVVLGGVFQIGQTLHVDSLGFTPEDVVIQSLALEDRGNADVLSCLQLTLTAPLQGAHTAGAFVTPDAPGLLLKAGVDTYALPSDWLGVEQESFDLTTGARSPGGRQGGFYDGAYSQSADLSGTGYGQRSDFGGGGYGASVFGPAGYLGQSANGCGQARFQFMDDAPARLTISPVPGANRQLDFLYRGCHCLETVPDGDSDAFVAYATYAALNAQAAQIARSEDKMAGDERAIYSKSRESLTAQAQVALAAFERQIVNRPYAASG